MKKGLYNIVQFTISLMLGLLLSYTGFGFIYWESDVSLWSEPQRAMSVVFGVVSAGPCFAMLFPGDKQTDKCNKNGNYDDVY